MEELKNFSASQLVNLLATEAITYYKLIGYDASVDECTQCNNRIKKIQMELALRRNPEERNILQRPVTAEYSF
jgi:hypothetical protein